MIKAEELEEKLANGDVDPQSLKEFSEIAANLSKFGLVDWCILGMPSTDGTCAKFHVKPEQLSEFMTELANLKDPRIGGGIFPIGIIAPDLFEVRLQMGVRRSGWTGVG